MSPWPEETKIRPLAIGATALVAGLVIWEVAARLFLMPLHLPMVSAILARGIVLLLDAEDILGAPLVVHAAASLGRIVVGFLIGSLLGVATALAMGAIPIVHRFLDPIVNFFRFIPPIAWISPFLIWFGIGELSKIALITYTVTFMVLLNTLAGIFAVHKSKVMVAQCVGANRAQIYCWVIVPATVRYMLDGMRIGLSNAFTTIVAAEMIAAQVGLGHLILVSRNFGATDIIFLAMIVLGLLGFGVDRLFDYLIRSHAGRFYRG